MSEPGGRNDAEVALYLNDGVPAFEVVEAVHPQRFKAAIATCEPNGDAGRYSVVQIAETGLPAGAGKLRTRMSRFSTTQWTKVVDRTLGAEMASVALWPGEPFDESDVAPQLPPGYPLSTLKGVRSGPVRLTVSVLSGSATVRLHLSPDEHLSANELFNVAAVLMRPFVRLACFEIAAVGTDLAQPPDTSGLDNASLPFAIVTGPALSEHRRQRVEAAASRSAVSAGTDVFYLGAAASMDSRLELGEQSGD